MPSRLLNIGKGPNAVSIRYVAFVNSKQYYLDYTAICTFLRAKCKMYAKLCLGFKNLNKLLNCNGIQVLFFIFWFRCKFTADGNCLYNAGTLTVAGDEKSSHLLQTL